MSVDKTLAALDALIADVSHVHVCRVCQAETPIPSTGVVHVTCKGCGARFEINMDWPPA